MFSLIICSRNRDISDELKNNISSTIGNYKYEIIVVDNSKREYSIFQAYNIGVKKAKFKYLCFMHEDILYMTNNWGGYVAKEFANSRIGMLGVVGGYYIGKYALTYYSSGYNTGQYYDKDTCLDWPKDIYGTDVVTIDGLWMCIKKDLFDNDMLKWDESTYQGFHFYDLDMSMQVLYSGFRIGIVKELYIKHFSAGNFNMSFYGRFY